MIETDDRFWDCECESDYIHNKKTEPYCKRCGTNKDFQPDSSKDEVDKMIECANDDFDFEEGIGDWDIDYF